MEVFSILQWGSVSIWVPPYGSEMKTCVQAVHWGVLLGSALWWEGKGVGSETGRSQTLKQSQQRTQQTTWKALTLEWPLSGVPSRENRARLLHLCG